VEDAFFDRGIGKTRLELVGSSSRNEHLRTLGRIDVALSPFPHAGGTTTFEALSLGLPVVALGGATIAERNSAAILSAVGRREWIGENVDDYIAIAIELAADREGLSRLRRELPAELRRHAACHPSLYMVEVDRAYRALWRAWCEARRGQS
jgi:predicted O-linked N-acetylglucosamine transferase (SPINDLY family)